MVTVMVNNNAIRNYRKHREGKPNLRVEVNSMYSTNIYISQPNWGLHPLLFYFWLLRPCFFFVCFFTILIQPCIPFFPVLIPYFQLYLPTFCTHKKSLVWLLSLIEFYSGHLIFMFCSCFPGADHAKSPCLTQMQSGPKHLHFLKLLTCILIADMLENPCPRIFYNSTNSELKWIMHTCWASQVAQW